MSKIKNFYHDEICKIDNLIDDEYFYDKSQDEALEEKAEEAAFVDLAYTGGILPA